MDESCSTFPWKVRCSENGKELVERQMRERGRGMRNSVLPGQGQERKEEWWSLNEMPLRVRRKKHGKKAGQLNCWGCSWVTLPSGVKSECFLFIFLSFFLSCCFFPLIDTQSYLFSASWVLLLNIKQYHGFNFSNVMYFEMKLVKLVGNYIRLGLCNMGYNISGKEVQ